MPRPALPARLPCSQRRPKPGPVPARGAKHPWFSRSRSGQVFRLRRQASSPAFPGFGPVAVGRRAGPGGALRHHGGGSAGEFHPCSCVRPRLSSASPRVPSPYDTAPAPRCQDRKGAPPQQLPALLLKKAPIHLRPVAVGQCEQVRRRAAGHSPLPASQKEGRRPRQRPSLFIPFASLGRTPAAAPGTPPQKSPDTPPAGGCRAGRTGPPPCRSTRPARRRSRTPPCRCGR